VGQLGVGVGVGAAELGYERSKRVDRDASAGADVDGLDDAVLISSYSLERPIPRARAASVGVSRIGAITGTFLRVGGVRGRGWRAAAHAC
jgi:hypothetical protein